MDPAAHDLDDPDTRRLTFVWVTALGGLLLLPPRQWASAAILLVLSAALFARHKVLRRRHAQPSSATKRSDRAEPSEGEAPVATEADESVSTEQGAPRSTQSAPEAGVSPGSGDEDGPDAAG